jgi:hypothetical protein
MPREMQLQKPIIPTSASLSAYQPGPVTKRIEAAIGHQSGSLLTTSATFLFKVTHLTLVNLDNTICQLERQSRPQAACAAR